MKSLDEEIRHALTALEHAVPEGYFDALPARIMEQLPPDAYDDRLEVEAMGPDMSTDSSKPGNAPPPPQGGTEQRTENTGLHDIKAMARTTKQRISRRVSTQSDVEESLLASASSQSLSAIVLPEPGQDEPSYESDDDAAVATPAVAHASATASAATTAARGGLPFWVYGAVGAVAVAAVVFFVMRGGSKKTEVAQHDTAAPVATPIGAGSPPPTLAPSASPIDPAPAIAEEDPAASDAPTDDGDGDQVVAAAAPGESEASAKDRDDDDSARGRAVPRATASSTSTKSTSARPAAPAPATSASSASASSSAPKSDPAKAKEPAKPKSADGQRSLDDLLDEASGGAVANRDLEGSGGPAKPEAKEPAKTDLSRAEIQAGMKKILGRVTACYDKYKEPGTVMIAVVIEITGEVSAADATGKFQNTETGLCVAEAVRRASFTSWEGKPKRFNYPFLLSD